jgi:hypothetical protein
MIKIIKDLFSEGQKKTVLNSFGKEREEEVI